MERARPPLLSLDQTQKYVPDHDYLSTADNLLAYGREPDEACFALEKVPVSSVDPRQLMDDAGDTEGWTKIASIRETLRTGGALPPVYVRHIPGNEHPYYLFEGKHRYNAAHDEGVATLTAWVAHIDCCDVGEVTRG